MQISGFSLCAASLDPLSSFFSYERSTFSSLHKWYGFGGKQAQQFTRGFCFGLQSSSPLGRLGHYLIGAEQMASGGARIRV